MNEAISIRLSLGGQDLEVDTLSADGVVLQRETGAPPRGISLILEPDSPVTEFRLRRVRQIKDWDPQEFHLNLSAAGGGLQITGVDNLSLPAGRYSLQLATADLVAQDQPVTVNIPDNGTATIVLQYKDDPRRVQPVPIDQYDDMTKALVTDPATLLDGLAAPDWLVSPLPRARRKACFLNLMAMLRGSAGPRPKSKLIQNVRSVFFADVDRIYARVDTLFLADLKTMADNPAKPFYAEGSPKAAIHQQLIQQIAAFEPDVDRYSLLSFRREGKPSLQAVVAIPPDDGRRHYADLDIDLGNPLQDIEGIVIHLGELLTPGKTDHLALARKLQIGPFSDFVYYTVVTV